MVVFVKKNQKKRYCLRHGKPSKLQGINLTGRACHNNIPKTCTFLLSCCLHTQQRVSSFGLSHLDNIDPRATSNGSFYEEEPKGTLLSSTWEAEQATRNQSDQKNMP
ncbi:hypothetical protein PS15m_004469 [Mucor circinelloides]